MLRLIVRCTYGDAEGHYVGSRFKTFDLHHPALEECLTDKDIFSTLTGCELIEANRNKEEKGQVTR